VRIFFMPAERPHGDMAVGLAAPRASPVLHAEQFLRRFTDERLDRVLVGEPVAAGDGVVAVLVQAVVRCDDARGAPFRRHGMPPHRIDLRHHGDAQSGRRFGDGDRGAEPGAVAADEHDIECGRH
jgi:hypothetical protein